jgi:hypothetical protein
MTDTDPLSLATELRRNTETLREIMALLRDIRDELRPHRIASTEARVDRLEKDRIERAFPDQ